MTEVITTKDAAAPGGAYSQAIVIGNVIATAGQVGVDPRTGRLGSTLEEQVEIALSNLDHVLRAAGSGFGDVVKTTCLLASIEDFGRFNEIYARRFSPPYPARSTFGVGLAGDILFEIEALAIRSGDT